MESKRKVVAGFGLGALLVAVGACSHAGRSESGPSSASRSGETVMTCVSTTELRAPGFLTGTPVAINARGQVAGVGEWASGYDGFFWDGETLFELGTLGAAGNIPNGINDDGWVVGYSHLSDGTTRAALWRNGTVVDLGGLGGNYSAANSINSSGQIVGLAQLSPDNGNDRHAFLWEGGVMRDLGTLGGRFSDASKINDRGQVIGLSTRADGGQVGYLWENGVMTDVGFFHDINQRGDLLGNAFAGSTSYLKRADGTVVQVLPFPDTTWTNASAMNDVGQVIGLANQGDGDTGFVWQEGAPTKTLGGAGSGNSDRIRSGKSCRSSVKPLAPPKDHSEA